MLDTMEPPTPRLFVDVGQTGSRVQDSTGYRATSAVRYSPGASLEKLIEEILSAAPHSKADTVLLSLTGLRGKVPASEPLALVCARLTGCRELGICDDGLAWSVGSLGGLDGVALAVGGGVVAVARSGNKFFHLDGNGSDFGDSGGAFWLGRKGFRAAIRSAEHSDQVTSLTEAFLDTFGAHDDFVRTRVARDDVHKAAITFSSHVLDAAQAGDEVASGIVSQGASRLGALVVAAATQAGLPDKGSTVALGGGLMKNGFYRQAVCDRIAVSRKEFTLIDPLGDALDGLIHLEKVGRDDIVNLMAWWKA